MNDGLLPASLVCAALGLVLGRPRADRALLATGLCAFGAAFGAVLRPSLGPTPLMAAWLSLAATAAAGVGRDGLPWPWILPLALNAGLWAGVSAGCSPALPGAVAAVAAAIPARLLARHGGAIVLRVAASWLVTIGVLNAAIPIFVPTPGYVRDHMD